MKCQAVYSWLLASRSAEEAPPATRRHLARCPGCRRRQRRLLQLHASIQQFPAPADNPIARAELLRRLDAAPVAVPPPLPLSRGKIRNVPFVWMALAASLLLSLGLVWWGRPKNEQRGSDPLASRPEVKQAEADTRIQNRLIARVVDHNIRLAEVVAPAAQMQELAEMASDLKEEAHRLSRQGPAEELPLTVWLYRQVVSRGILGRARELPADLRDDLLTPLSRCLQEGGAETLRIADTALPTVRDHLAVMATTDADAAKLLLSDRPQVPKGPFPDFGPVRPVFASLVLNGLVLAEERDPLRRADICSDVADSLVEAIVLSSSGDNMDRASVLGTSLNAVMDRGIAFNLERARAAEMDKTRQAEFERVSQRASRATSALQANLEKAPPAAQAGLQRAAEASAQGRGRAAQAVKGKGKSGHPVFGPGGKPNVPPGQQKKKDRDE